MSGQLAQCTRTSSVTPASPPGVWQAPRPDAHSDVASTSRPVRRIWSTITAANSSGIPARAAAALTVAPHWRARKSS